MYKFEHRKLDHNLLHNTIWINLESENKTAIVLGATSGDTGSAAIDACKSYDRIKSFIMLPNGNMSEVQQRQMSHILQTQRSCALRKERCWNSQTDRC